MTADMIFTGIPSRKEIMIHLRIKRKCELSSMRTTKRQKLKQETSNYISILRYKTNLCKQVICVKGKIKYIHRQILCRSLIISALINYKCSKVYDISSNKCSKAHDISSNDFFEVICRIYMEMAEYKIHAYEYALLHNSVTVNTDTHLAEKDGPAFVVNEFFVQCAQINSRYKNLKFLTESSSQKFVNLDELIPVGQETTAHKIEFDFKAGGKREHDNVLAEISDNIPKRGKKTQPDQYKKILQRNTQINSMYRNVRVYFTNAHIETTSRKRHIREQTIKWEENAEPDIHNPSQPVPILKPAKNVCKKKTQKKMKEIVFVQNITG